MKQLIILTFLFFTIFSCNKNLGFINNTNKKDHDEFVSELFKMGMTLEEVCQNEKLRAKHDIDNGKLVYFFNFGKSSHIFNMEEYHTILKPMKIDTSFYLTSCLREAGKREFYDCYPKLMRQALEEKYGNSFINLIDRKADSLYVLNNIEQTINNSELTRYFQSENYKKFNDSLELTFHKEFIYPKGYMTKVEGTFPLTRAYFYFDRNGNMDSLEVESYFTNKNNKKFRGYFESEFRKFIENKKWLISKCYNIPVNSNIYFSVYHK